MMKATSATLSSATVGQSDTLALHRTTIKINFSVALKKELIFLKDEMVKWGTEADGYGFGGAKANERFLTGCGGVRIIEVRARGATRGGTGCSENTASLSLVLLSPQHSCPLLLRMSP